MQDINPPIGVVYKNEQIKFCKQKNETEYESKDWMYVFD